MKDRFYVILNFLVLFLEVFLFFGYSKNEAAYTYSSEYFYLKDTVLVQDNLYVETNIDENRIYYLLKYFNELPDWIKEKFINDDWKLVLKRDLLKEKNTVPIDSCLEGVTSYYPKIISIKQDALSLKDTLYHEISHFIDGNDFIYSSTPIFQGLYTQYKDSYKKYVVQPSILYYVDNSSYAASSTIEFFASTFSDYLNSPEYVKKQAPLLYDYYEGFF